MLSRSVTTAAQSRYSADAYHSLSIEGYRVSDALMERVRSGAWNPGHDETDRQNRDALAARGYWQASVHRDIAPFTRYLAARLAASAQL